MKPIHSGSQSPKDLRPRLRIVLPLLAVCFLTIGFLLHDLIVPTPEQSAASLRPELLPETVPGSEPTSQPPSRAASRFFPPRPLASPEFAEEITAPVETDATVVTEPVSPPIATPPPKPDHVPRIAPLLMHANGGTVIRGFINLQGEPPPERELPHDPTCGAAREGKFTTRLYRKDPVTGGLADVIVYMKQGIENLTYRKEWRSVGLRVVGCEFNPYVLTLQTGQELLLSSFDPTIHAVRTVPTVQGNRGSTIALTSNSRIPPISFDQPELFLPVRCDTHPWMFAYIGVFRHPFHTVTFQDGTFQIPYVPAGTYVIEAAHRKAGRASREITVDGVGDVRLDFTLEVPPSGI